MTDTRTRLHEKFEVLRRAMEEKLVEGFRDGNRPNGECTCPSLHLAHQITYFDSKGTRGSTGGFSPQVGYEALEWFAMITRFAFEPEWVAYQGDGFAPVLPINPETNMPWTIDEVYAEGNTDGYGHRGKVTDAIVVELVDIRTGTHFQRAMPYRISRDDGIVFKPPVIHPYPATWLIRGMTMDFPKDMPWQNLDVDFEGFPVEAQRALRLRAVLDFLQNKMGIALFKVHEQANDNPMFRELLEPYYLRDVD